MTFLRQSSRARWTVPLILAAVLAAMVVGRATLAGASPALPRLTAAQLLIKVSQTHVDAMSGVLRTSSDLGLPSLPDVGRGLTPQALLSGKHTLRVYLDGADRQRVDLLGTLAERKLVHNGRNLWMWSSSTNQATHATLPVEATQRGAGGRTGHQLRRSAMVHPVDATPQAIADRLLQAVGPTTTVSAGSAATVAGRSAYDLRLSPKSADSLIQQADLFVDSATGLPLRVTVLARGATNPAIDIGFTSITFKAPPARVFTFTAPPGVKVHESAGLPDMAGLPGILGLSGPDGMDGPDGTAHGTKPPVRPGNPGLDRGLLKPHAALAHLAPKVLGSGWTAVVEVEGLPSGGLGGTPFSVILQGARKVTGTFGSGRVLTTTLLTVLITDDGRVFAGAVTPAVLVRTANTAR